MSKRELMHVSGYGIGPSYVLYEDGTTDPPGVLDLKESAKPEDADADEVQQLSDFWRPRVD